MNILPVKAAIDIVPKPVKLVETSERFDMTSACSIVVSDDLRTFGELLADYLQPAMGYRLAVSNKAKKSKPVIRLSIDKSLKNYPKKPIGWKLPGREYGYKGLPGKVYSMASRHCCNCFL